jgi:putative transposase
MLAVTDLASHIGMQAACSAFAFNPGFVYRDRAKCRRVLSPRLVPVRPRPPLAFSIAEQNYLLGVLDSERFADTAPATVFATLLDEGRYHGSVRTMYRLLGARARRASGAASAVTPSIASPSCLRCGRTKCGRGISQKSKVQPSGRVFTCTSSSIFSAAPSWVG